MTMNRFNNYNKEVMKRFMDPKFMGEMEDYDGIGEVGNMKCGDVMRIYLKVDDKTKKITKVSFQTFGCVAAIASSDALCEVVKARLLKKQKR